jgi:hypothetical protein
MRKFWRDAGRSVGGSGLSRRQWLQGVLGAGAGLALPGVVGLERAWGQQHTAPAQTPSPSALGPGDDATLFELECLNFRYFWEQADPATGLVKDRCDVRAATDTGTVGSIAATGFGLTALCIGEERGLVLTPDAEQRVLTTLRFLWKKLPNHRGFFYHFANVSTGERVWDSEVSSVDTALLLCGVLMCRQHFHNEEITRLANDIFNRVDWTWLSEDTSLLPHGWTPELGFLPYRWDY